MSRPITDDDVKEIRSLVDAGLSVVEIATAVDRHRTTISRLCAQLNLNPVSRRRSGRRPKIGSTHRAQGGYRYVIVSPDDPVVGPMAPQTKSVSSRYVLEHRAVMAWHLGRPLESWETVHHINGDRVDNRIENLQLRSGRHGKGAAFRCRSCGSCDVEAVQLAGEA